MYIELFFRVIPAIFTSLVICYVAIPAIMRIAIIKKLIDEPDTVRKFHKSNIPTLGGIGIFSAFLISFSIWGHAATLESYPFFVAGLFMLFLIGIKDDILMISPFKKFAIQLFAATEVVLGGGIVITNFGGIFGFYAVPYYLGAAVTIFIFVALINSYNLIDGIDGLAGGIGIVVAAILGIWFWVTGFVSLAVLSFALTGSLIGFMIYNIHPAQIFMGDTGSMAVGFILSYICIQFLIVNDTIIGSKWHFENAQVFAIALLIIPIVDTIRVFFLRLIQGKSPFAADRNHTHHKLLDLQMEADLASCSLWMGNFILVAFAFYFNYIEINTLFLLVMTGGFLILPVIKYSYKGYNKIVMNLRARSIYLRSSGEDTFFNIRRKKQAHIFDLINYSNSAYNRSTKKENEDDNDLQELEL